MKKINTSKRLLMTVMAVPVVSLFPLSITSCGLNQPWDWKTATKDNTEINYCLLIGQNDHTDSQMRTKGSRVALGTMDKDYEGNPNTAKPHQGNITLSKDGGGTESKKQFVVNEIEHMEQKSIGGASWDPITANATASTWIAKHGNNITFFVSNNDSMAEGAYWASNWIKGMPIFGYDANSTTLQWINSGQITGTVDQSPSSQAAAAMMILRTMYDKKIKFWENYDISSLKSGDFGKEDYDPTSVGFNSDYSGYGYVDYTNPQTKETVSYFTKREPRASSNANEAKIFQNNEILAKSTAITRVKDIAAKEMQEDIVDISQFLIEGTTTAKQPRNMFDQFTSISKTNDTPSDDIKICHTYSNKSEAFLIATMKPYYDEYAKRLNIVPAIFQGDGTDETLVLNQINATTEEHPGGYLICLAKTTSALEYVHTLADRAFKYESKKLGTKKTEGLKKYDSSKYGASYEWKWQKDGWDNFEERLDTPLIFWIREPSDASTGKPDETILHNKFFKYTYYIGADSENAGEVQGKLITSAINRWYTDSIRK